MMRIDFGWARLLRLAAALSLAGLLAACADTDHVLFVTNTNVGVGYDATTLSGHVGYKRQEVYAGPAYTEYGGLPPVAASLQSDLNWLAPSSTQYYVTGDAALIATHRIAAPTVDETRPGSFTDQQASERCRMNAGCTWSSDAPRSLSVVGTSSHVGLVVKTASSALSALDFGYGRQEASLLALRTKSGGVGDIYPSAFASIKVDTDKDASGIASGLAITQFFATGGAADALAGTSEVRTSFATMAKAQALTQTRTLLAGTNLSPNEADSLTTEGATAAARNQAQISGSVAKVLGRPVVSTEALSDTDISAITKALQSLPGIDAAAYKLPDNVKTVGGFLTWLDGEDKVAQALVQREAMN